VKLATILGTLLLFASAPPALAVDEGVPDRDRHPNVGLLGFDLDADGPVPPAFLCSGSVLSDRLFLTAAHCMPAVPEDVEWVVTLQAGGPATPVARPGVFPDDFPFPLTVPAKRGGVAIVHPRFDADARTHDIAVVRFPPRTFSGVEPVALPTARLLDRLHLSHRIFRLVGYGADPEFGDGPPTFVVEGYRQTATAPFLALTRRQLRLDGDAAATGRGGLCLGDSGSPQFLGESRVAVSLLSSTADDCRGPLVGQRLDTRSARRFLRRFVELP
jgi:Trypsin